MVSPFLLAVIVVVVAALIKMILLKKGKSSLPGPTGLPIVGIQPFLSHPRYKDLTELAKKYGDIYQCKIGDKNFVVVSSLSAMDEMMRKRGVEFNNRFPEASGGKGTNYGFSEMDVSPEFHEARLRAINILNYPKLGGKSVEQIFLEELDSMCSYLDKVHKTSAFDPRGVCHNFMANILQLQMFSRRWDYDNPKISKIVDWVRDATLGLAPERVTILKTVLRFFRILDETRDDLHLSKAVIDIYGHCTAEVKDHKSTLKADFSRDFADMMMLQMMNNEGKGLATEGIIRTMQNLMTGGTITGGMLTGWVVYFLIKYPTVQKKLREEVDRVIGQERLPSTKDRQSCPYVNAFVDEVHRIATIAPLGMNRYIKEDVEFRGYKIPAGTFMIPNYYAVHYDGKSFKNPHEFNPDRFINQKGEVVRSKKVIPFSTGVRSCPGEVIIRRQQFLFVTRMVQKYQIIRADDAARRNFEEDAFFDGVGRFPPPFDARFIPRSI